MASQPEPGVVAEGQPGDRLPAPGGTEETLWQTRPVGPLEARRVQTHNLAEMAAWCGGIVYDEDTVWDYSVGGIAMPGERYAFVSPCDWGVIVPPPQGHRHKVARPGWWIIKSAKGEFGTCDPGFFAATYEPAAADPETLPDAEHAIGNVIRHAESWAEQGGQLDASEVARVLLLVLRQWTGMPPHELEAIGTGPLLDPDCRAGKCASCVGAPCEHECHKKPEEAHHGV
jgi:hypothetical protein